ncbi:hypothetical protein ACVBEF_11195 [Glaciimonas sp. GG7]
MSRLLKIALLWLLVFALPIQGFASAGMLACVGAHQHRMPGISQHDGDSADVEQDAAHHGQFSSSGFHQDAAGNTSSDGNHHHAAAKCSACASCCLSTAISLPLTLDPIAPFQTDLAFRSHSDARFTAHFPEGLERPPHSLAS